jgi:hypothetical protein
MGWSQLRISVGQMPDSPIHVALDINSNKSLEENNYREQRFQLSKKLYPP